jgi:Flp pilus assembly pilin Flp
LLPKVILPVKYELVFERGTILGACERAPRGREVRAMRFLKDRSGAEVTEVAVIIILIIVAAYAAIRAFGLRISALFEWLSGLF